MSRHSATFSSIVKGETGDPACLSCSPSTHELVTCSLSASYVPGIGGGSRIALNSSNNTAAIYSMQSGVGPDPAPASLLQLYTRQELVFCSHFADEAVEGWGTG